MDGIAAYWRIANGDDKSRPIIFTTSDSSTAERLKPKFEPALTSKGASIFSIWHFNSKIYAGLVNASTIQDLIDNPLFIDGQTTSIQFPRPWPLA